MLPNLCCLVIYNGVFHLTSPPGTAAPQPLTSRLLCGPSGGAAGVYPLAAHTPAAGGTAASAAAGTPAAGTPAASAAASTPAASAAAGTPAAGTPAAGTPAASAAAGTPAASAAAGTQAASESRECSKLIECHTSPGQSAAVGLAMCPSKPQTSQNKFLF